MLGSILQELYFITTSPQRVGAVKSKNKEEKSKLTFETAITISATGFQYCFKVYYIALKLYT